MAIVEKENEVLFEYYLLYQDKYVEVICVDGSKHEGKVYTICPITGSIVLLSLKDKSIGLDIIMGHAVKCIAAVTPPATIVDIPEDIFDRKPNSYTSHELEVRKNKLKEWFHLNKIPIEENGEVLRLKDVIELRPPYEKDDCRSLDSNELILGRMQDLISAMP